MLLPPNLLLWEEDVTDFNENLQVGTTTKGERLFSSSITPDDVDTRNIAEGEPITFDYDETDDDLRGDRGGFLCKCGAKSCRGEILGRLYSPKAAPEEEPAFGLKGEETDAPTAPPAAPAAPAEEPAFDLKALKEQEAAEMKKKIEENALKAKQKEKEEDERIAKMQALEAQGVKVAGGMHKFDASEVDVHGGNATADDFLDAFGM
jgi:hypothetical protein